MLYTELELKRLLKKGYKNMTVEEEITFNILNFIHCIHLNGQDFYRAVFDSIFFGDLEMIFKKDPNCLVGYSRAIDKKGNKTYEYLFTENGFEMLYKVVK
jgi:hypothetical protein